MTLKLRDSYTFELMLNAYMDCRKSKRNSRSAIAFETRFEERLIDLLDELNSGSYEIGRSSVFVVTEPKPREIWASDFRDRVIHHLIYNDIGWFFERRLIEDTFSCIRGRGSLAASDRLKRHHASITRNYASDCWYLQFDIKNFFVSIDRAKLWEIISEHAGGDSLTSRTLKQIVFNDPTERAILKQGDFSSVPRHKSLWHAPKGKGLPIGNLTSQFFSNVYLNPLDQFVKHKLKARRYARYVDDAVILHEDRDQLELWLAEIDQFLQAELMLSLHPDKCFIKRASQGINFVGYVVKPWRRYTRSTTVNKAKRAKSRESINSYLGIMRRSNSHNIRKEICQQAAMPTLLAHDSDYTKMVEL